MTSIINQRFSGVLLHPTSLPNTQAQGRLGSQAYRWIDWLSQSGFRVWQVLPLGPTTDGSPYNSFSAFAGNEAIIEIAHLSHLGFPETWGGLDDSTLSQNNTTNHRDTLKLAHQWLDQQPHHALNQQFQKFKQHEQQKSWLDDYSLFATIKKHYPTHWCHWPDALKNRDKSVLHQIQNEYRADIELEKFIQFVFYSQWKEIKQYANQKGIYIFGDIPIFVSHDSADVWANPTLFKLDNDGMPSVVAGVPPDYFSEYGQRWGNPLYHWPHHQSDHFAWWRARLAHSLTLFDAVRIDHFRGLVSCWEIPATEETAIHGCWESSPGSALLKALFNEHPYLPIIAEDLGIITQEVTDLRKQFNIPGMKILQFAFDSDGRNPYLPHNHNKDAVIYTGTHDNNTTLGWFNALNPGLQQHIRNYYAFPKEAMPWPIIKSALASPANWAIIPLQDLLELDESTRMNTPGTIENNWRWQFDWDQFRSGIQDELRSLNRMYNRIQENRV